MVGDARATVRGAARGDRGNRDATSEVRADRLVGGATEETIIARVGEGIVEAIGTAKTAAMLLR